MIEIFPVIKNVWCLRRPSYLTCSYAVETAEGLLFIDASMDSRGRDIEFALGKLGKSPSDVLGAIITHWHNDHSAGTDYIEKVCKRPVFSHHLEGEKLCAEPQKGILNRLSQLVPEAGPLVLLKGLLNEGPSVKLDSFTAVKNGQRLFEHFEIVETPGHTAGHLSVIDHKNGVIFAGDALAVVGKKLRRMARPVTEDLSSGLQSMMNLLSFDMDIICPGHRSPMIGAKSTIDEFRKELETKSSWPLFG